MSSALQAGSPVFAFKFGETYDPQRLSAGESPACVQTFKRRVSFTLKHESGWLH